MVWMMIILAIPATYYLCKWWVKGVFWVFGNPLKRQRNLYINAHRVKIDNDRQYDEYLKWLNKKGEGVPIPKVMTKEDAEAEKQIKRLI